MKRTFNYTSRRRIPSDRIAIRIIPNPIPGLPAAFDASMDLSGLDLPAHASVFLDPYVNTSSMRFSYGTVEHISPPEDRRLTEIDEGKGIQFRLLIVDPSEQIGKVLASARSISPISDEKSRQSLFPLQMRDLGQEIWIVDLEGERPHLVLNSRIAGIEERIKADPLLRGCVYPHALRIVLGYVYGEERPSDDEPWVDDWKAFVKLLIGESRAAELDDTATLDDEQLEVVVGEFAKRGNYASKFLLPEQQHA